LFNLERRAVGIKRETGKYFAKNAEQREIWLFRVFVDFFC
jgi:hypothetical protein